MPASLAQFSRPMRVVIAHRLLTVDDEQVYTKGSA